MDMLELVGAEQVKADVPEFNPGDDVAVHFKVVEGDKQRIQVFRGLCIQKRGGGINKTFTVRKISGGVGVERIFPLYSPLIQKIERTRKGRIRRAKLFYLRQLKGKAAKIEEQIES
ncbi:MAG: 50S ribosomal protein L19 [bacterium]|nr:50S ribosomal protein L19 [bacterium]